MNKVKKLYSIGHAKWYNLFKPIWNWLASRKAEKKLAKFLKDNINESTTILELGCGTALNLKKILSLNLQFKKYIGLDFSEDMLKIARRKFKTVSGVEFKHQDLGKLDHLHEKADIILCTWVLSHLHSPANIVNQAQKLLAPNGKMFLIFLSKPKWYINFWFCLISKYIFQSKCLTKEEIKKFNNIKSIKHFAASITTVVEINK